MSILELLQKRASVRKYQDRPVPQAVIRDLLEAGRLSPSGGNEQPWAFGVITDPERIRRIAGIAHQQTWIEQAPLVIVLCTLPVSDERGGRDIQLHRYPALVEAITSIDQHLYWALNQEEHQTKIAGSHMVLAALEHGLGSCWVSRFDVQRLADLLQLPETCLPAEMLVFGYPEHSPHPLPKKTLDRIVFYETWPPHQSQPGSLTGASGSAPEGEPAQ